MGEDLLFKAVVDNDETYTFVIKKAIQYKMNNHLINIPENK